MAIIFILTGLFMLLPGYEKCSLVDQSVILYGNCILCKKISSAKNTRREEGSDSGSLRIGVSEQDVVASPPLKGK